MADRTTRIVLITVDSLRADALGLYGAPGATPNLDALGEEALVFQNAFATGPHTTQSFPGILASNYPTTGGTVQNLASRVSVAEHFRSAGFSTAGFHSNPLLSRGRGYARGFDAFWDSLPDPGEGVQHRPPRVLDRISACVARRSPLLFGLARRAYRASARRLRQIELPHESAETVNERAIEWLRSAGESFFLWLHYMDPHWPYATRLPGLSERERKEARRLSKEALRRPGRLREDDVARLREFYLREVGHLDECLGRLFDFMKGAGLWQGTAVFLTSDHGQAFMEHGITFHGDLLYDELIRVPLIVKASGIEPATRGGVASLIDLAPTLCQVAGLEQPSAFEGRPLLGAPPREAAFAETAFRLFVSETPKRVAVRTAGWKLIRSAEDGAEELYDMAADPAEGHNMLGRRPEVAAAMRALLEDHLNRERPRLERRHEPTSGAAEDETVRARLRALGYMDEAE